MGKTNRDEILSFNIGPKIKILRKKQKLTLQDLSNKTGFSKPLLSQIENGHVIPPLPTLLGICRALDVPMRYFIPKK